MASAEFCEAVAYALSCVGRQDLTLKPKQEEALVVVHLTMVRMSLFGSLLAMAIKSLCYQLLPFMFDFKLKRTSCHRTGNKGGQ